ncbi:MAG: phospholipase D-like domain-containing protein [Paracoccaceae bacterium]
MTTSKRFLTSRKIFSSLALLALVVFAPPYCTFVPFDAEKVSTSANDITATGNLHLSARSVTDKLEGKSSLYPLVDGNDALGARLKLIAQAEHTIDMQYFLMKPDRAGSVISVALVEASKRGVRVRFLLDDIFTTVTDKQLAYLDSFENIELRLFNPLSRNSIKLVNFALNFNRVNRRMHNKSMTVDNSVSVFGGRNIADEYFQLATNAEFADFDMLAIGPAVQQIAAEFDLFWNDAATVPIKAIYGEINEEDLQKIDAQSVTMAEKALAETYKKAVNSTYLTDIWQEKVNALAAEAQLVTDNPDKIRVRVKDGGDLRVLSNSMNQQILSATSDVMIITPYFVPRRRDIDMYKQASKNGVRVRILTNSLASTNHAYVHGGYAPSRKELLKAGVELYEVRADAPQILGHVSADSDVKLTMHTKAAAFDNATAFVGSMNFDPRSIEINTEVGIFISASTFADELVQSINKNLNYYTFAVSLDENDDLIWTYVGDGTAPEIFTSEPGAGILDLIVAKVASVLPVRGQM